MQNEPHEAEHERGHEHDTAPYVSASEPKRYELLDEEPKRAPPKNEAWRELCGMSSSVPYVERPIVP